MSTRGIIAIENPDKTCRAIYVHFDKRISNITLPHFVIDHQKEFAGQTF